MLSVSLSASGIGAAIAAGQVELNVHRHHVCLLLRLRLRLSSSRSAGRPTVSQCKTTCRRTAWTRRTCLPLTLFRPALSLQWPWRRWPALLRISSKRPSTLTSRIAQEHISLEISGRVISGTANIPHSSQRPLINPLQQIQESGLPSRQPAAMRALHPLQ